MDRNNKDLIIDYIHYVGYTDRKTIVDFLNIYSNSGDKEKTVSRNIIKLKSEVLDVIKPFNNKKEVYKLSDTYLKDKYGFKNKIKNINKSIKLNKFYNEYLIEKKELFIDKDVVELFNDYIFNLHNDNLNFDYSEIECEYKVFDGYIKNEEEVVVVIYIDKNIDSNLHKMCCYVHLFKNNKNLKLKILYEDEKLSNYTKKIVDKAKNKVIVEGYNPYSK